MSYDMMLAKRIREILLQKRTITFYAEGIRGEHIERIVTRLSWMRGLEEHGIEAQIDGDEFDELDLSRLLSHLADKCSLEVDDDFLISPLGWSGRLPRLPGYYWHRPDGEGDYFKARVYHVERGDNGVLHVNAMPIESMGGAWSDRSISPPGRK